MQSVEFSNDFRVHTHSPEEGFNTEYVDETFVIVSLNTAQQCNTLTVLYTTVI